MALISGPERITKEVYELGETTSRQRLLAAMDVRALDRVPISTYELVGWNPGSFENTEPSYSTLMDAIREYTDCIYMTGPKWKPLPESHAVHTMCRREEWREGPSRYIREHWSTPKGDLVRKSREDDGIHTVWSLEPLLKSIDDIDKWLSIPFDPTEADMDDFYADQERLGEKGVMMLSVADPVCMVAELFGMEEFLVHAICEPERIIFLLDAIHERQRVQLKSILSKDVRGVQFRIVGAEYVTPPYLGPEHFNRYVTPYLRDICSDIRSVGGFARVHCHGKISRILDYVVDAGAQGLDPIEPPPDGDITLADVKARYGRDLCLFGNIELRDLETADADHVRELVKRAMDQSKEGGGFVLMPTAAPINVPLSPRTEGNYMAYIEAGLEYGRY